MSRLRRLSWEDRVALAGIVFSVAVIAFVVLLGVKFVQQDEEWRGRCRDLGGIPIPSGRSGQACARPDGGYIDVGGDQ